MRINAIAISTAISVLLVATVIYPIITDTATAGEDTLDVIVLGGQSNIAYIPQYMDLDVVNEEIPQPAVDCYYYGISDRPVWINADLSLCGLHSMNDDGRWIIGGEEAAIAYYVSKKTNDDVLIINAAIPAYSISQFEPGTTGGTYISTVIANALSEIPEKYNVIKCGWVWCQGESDRTTPVADYVASFDDVASIFSNNGFNKCYMVQTLPAHSGNATQAQSQIVATHSNVVMASTSPATFSVAEGTLLEGNELHYSQTGRDIVGTDVGSAIAANLTSHIRSDTTTDLLYLVPLLVIVGIILGVVTMAFARRE